MVSGGSTETTVHQPHAGSTMAFVVGIFFSSRIAIVFVCARILGLEPRLGAELGIAINLILLTVVCFHSLGSGSRTLGSMLRLSSIRWVFAFLAFSGCSLAWSLSVSPSSSAVYWCALVADVAMVMVLFCGDSAVSVAHSLMKGFVWSTCFLALVAWLMPAQADLRLGDPDYFNTNQIASACAFAIFLAQFLMSRKDGKWGVAILFLIVTLIRSLSKTTIAAFLLSEAFLLFRDRSMTRRAKLLVTSAILLALLVFWGLFAAYYDVYTNAGNQAETLTGRTAIWAFAVEGALQRPWVGNGFDSMWKVMPPFGSDQFQARHAENEVLQQFYAYGAAGVVMLAGIYGSLYWRTRKLPRGSSRTILFSLFLFVWIRGLAEAEPFDLLLPLWAVVLLSVLLESEDETGWQGVISAAMQNSSLNRSAREAWSG